MLILVQMTQLQSIIERPVIYMFAAGSSSIDDQAALLYDRVDCLHSLSETVATSTGIEIEDKLRFFLLEITQLSNLKEALSWEVNTDVVGVEPRIS